jgi:hypothetical protein
MTVQEKPHRHTVAEILNCSMPKTVLDAPSGSGWLRSALNYDMDIDGIDLFESKPDGYRLFKNGDLDLGIPDDLPLYEAIVSCEGVEHIGNPGLFLKTASRHLQDEGTLIITTPNTWYPAAKLQFYLRGFFPGFPCLVGRIRRGTHMHVTPWSFPQLFLFLSLSGYHEIRLHDVPEKKPKHFYERALGAPQRWYCRHKARHAETVEERLFWQDASSPQSIYGRRLVVSAKYRKDS